MSNDLEELRKMLMGSFVSKEDKLDESVPSVVEILTRTFGDDIDADDISLPPAPDVTLSSYGRNLVLSAMDVCGTMKESVVGDQFFREKARSGDLFAYEGAAYQDMELLKNIPRWYADSFGCSGIVVWYEGIVTDRVFFGEDYGIEVVRKLMVPLSEEKAIILDTILCAVDGDFEVFQRVMKAMHLLTSSISIAGYITNLRIDVTAFYFISADIFRPSLRFLRELKRCDTKQFRHWVGLADALEEGVLPWTRINRLYVLAFSGKFHDALCTTRSCEVLCHTYGLEFENRVSCAMALCARRDGDNHLVTSIMQSLFDNMSRHPFSEDLSEVAKKLDLSDELMEVVDVPRSNRAVSETFSVWNAFDIYLIHISRVKKISGSENVYLLHVCPQMDEIPTHVRMSDTTRRMKMVSVAVETSFSKFGTICPVRRMRPETVSMAVESIRNDLIRGNPYICNVYQDATGGVETSHALDACTRRDFLAAQRSPRTFGTDSLRDVVLKKPQDRERSAFLSPCATLDMVMSLMQRIEYDMCGVKEHELGSRIDVWLGNSYGDDIVMRDLMNMFCDPPVSADETVSFDRSIIDVYERGDELARRILIRPHDDPFSVCMSILMRTQRAMESLDKTDLAALYLMQSDIHQDPGAPWGIGFTAVRKWGTFGDYMDSLWDSVLDAMVGVSASDCGCVFSVSERAHGSVPTNDVTEYLDCVFMTLHGAVRDLMGNSNMKDATTVCQEMSRTDTMLKALYICLLLGAQGNLTHDFYSLVVNGDYGGIIVASEMLVEGRSGDLLEYSSGVVADMNEEGLATPVLLRFVMHYMLRKILI